ncbi:MAG: hypothetical protein L3J52_03490, partial [Proteobacteria bacterium]|nr:hypothetical protein [Pseudomonadota bacterium]
RQNAAIKATELLTASISSEVPLNIQGCWPELEATPTTAILANARPRTLFANTPGSKQNTWHPVASAERLAGTKSCKLHATGCDDPAIIINYNKLIDTPQGLGNIRWYYGLNSSSNTSNPDFISTTMHEILHGLGFQSNIWLSEDTEQLSCSQQLILHQTGSLLCNRSDIYTDKLAYHNNDQLTLLHEMQTNEQRITAITSEDKLVWDSIEVAASAANNLKSQGTGLVLLHAPDEIESGSSVSHLHSSYTELMEPTQSANLRTLGLADPMLRELGWDPTSKTSAGVIPGLWHNPAMSGHGFSVEPIGRDDLYFVVFYSYDNNGLPEWYTSLVTLEDGVLNAEFSPTLVRTVYNYNSTNPAAATASNDPSVQGGISIDFNSFDASRSGLCNDGVNRSDTNAIVRWKINDQESFWCIQPTINPSSYPKQDFGGVWWAGREDSGWGISISLLRDVLVVGIYYYDSDGNPRWAIGQTDGFIVGEASSLTFRQVQGFGRDQPPGDNTTTNIGTATFTLSDNQGSLDTDGLMSIDIQFLGDNAQWSRDNIKIANFTQAH